MTNDQALSSKLWPHPFHWSNYTDVFHQAPLWRYTLNTMLYAGLATLGVLVSSIPVAYALARLRWRGRDAVFLLVLVAMMLPPQVTVVPLYVMWAKLHLVGTLWPLIIPNWFGDAFSIFLLRQFFLTIPEEYLDAARVDGCGELRILPPSSCGWPSRRSPPSRCSRSSTPGTTSSSRCSTSGENPDNWTLSLGLSQFRTPAPGAVEPDDGGDAAVHGAGHRRSSSSPRRRSSRASR